jgi:uncharacterized protein (DUF1697 family)
MTTYVALLRAVNVGGTGKLPMSDLKALCLDAGFTRIETYIASGNVVFDSKAAAARVKSALEERLRAYAGKPVGVVVRSAADMSAVLTANRFPKTEPKHTHVIFLNAPPPRDAVTRVGGMRDEKVRLGERKIFVHYPSGLGASKLKIPAAKDGTARNMNTVFKLVEMSARA